MPLLLRASSPECLECCSQFRAQVRVLRVEFRTYEGAQLPSGLCAWLDAAYAMPAPDRES